MRRGYPSRITVTTRKPTTQDQTALHHTEKEEGWDRGDTAEGREREEREKIENRERETDRLTQSGGKGAAEGVAAPAYLANLNTRRLRLRTEDRQRAGVSGRPAAATAPRAAISQTTATD